MRGYGQFCPIAKASEVIGERWTNLIVRELISGAGSFNDLRRGLPLISPSLLSKRLKTLENFGVVTRRESPQGIRYDLTQAGEELKPIIMQLGVWGHRWVRTDLSPDDLDPSLVVWDIHRNLDTGAFGDGRTVLLFEFTEYTSKNRFWWLVVSRGDVDVCLKDPGFDVAIRIVTDVRTLTAVWIGDLGLGQAMRNGGIVVDGDEHLKRTMPGWLGANVFADVKPANQSSRTRS